MTLPASGAISLFDVNTELGLTHSAQIGLLCTNVRTLFGTASGAVGLQTGYGKSNTSVPGVPTGVSASATSCSAISVSFSAPACTGHLTIDSYQVVCTSSGSKTATGSSSPISVTGLSASTSYTFKVRAHNSIGYGCYSSTASATTNRNTASYTFSTNTACASLNITSLSGYVSGATDVTITVNSGVYIYASTVGPYCTPSPGLTLTGGTSGDTVTLVNNGYIMGAGGSGNPAPGPYCSKPGTTALKIGYPTTINNTNANAYIGGGGGAGGYIGSGGGAGGANGHENANSGAGGAGGGPGSKGQDGRICHVCCCGTSYYYLSGGGGGRIFPGCGGAGATGTTSPARGGGAGGGGGRAPFNGSGGAGGAGNSAGGAGACSAPGGGGGWGASGGTGAFIAGKAGGKAVCLNGYSVTWVSGNTTRVYGAVS